MNLVSLQLGRPRESVSHLKDGNDAKWVSSIWRTPVNERLHLGRTDLAGNAQADLKNHGGPDKAVCCYSAEHYPDWRDLLELSEEEFGYGAFGENFTVTELTENAVCLGDIYALGTATVQVSQPRMPCWKVGRRWERPDLPASTRRCTSRKQINLRTRNCRACLYWRKLGVAHSAAALDFCATGRRRRNNLLCQECMKLLSCRRKKPTVSMERAAITTGFLTVQSWMLMENLFGAVSVRLFQKRSGFNLYQNLNRR
jgi:hypothetical protein